MVGRAHEELVVVPRSAVRFPLELPIPPGFDPDEPKTWPEVEGSLEYYDGKLFYMPPTADNQSDTSIDVAGVLFLWRRKHREFVVGGNEAGMVLDGETRGADAAVWRRADLGPNEGKHRRVPPVLAVEIQGRFEDEATLRAKAQWYRLHGVAVVWLLFPTELRAIVSTSQGEHTIRPGQRLPRDPALPDLEPMLDELFEQVEGR